MQIIINAIEYQEENIIVNCDLDIGMLKGIWKGKNPPVLNFHYYVELTLDDLIPEQIKALPRNKKYLVGVKVKNNDVLFAGICEDYDGEIYYIRFACDWLEMIDVKEDAQSIHLEDNVLFWIDYHQVQIFPYDIL
ncbi:MAG: hypothetical protein K2G25_08405 [Oscillospiraceae bacterium]|nr:hypothetical protein [Oscillospiraceae bacterium]